jgi:hypothetical protein
MYRSKFMIPIGRYSFEGPYPYPDTTRLQDRSGVYVILDRQRDGQRSVLDVGESATVKTRVNSHDRQDCWNRNRRGTLEVAVLHTPEFGRKEIEREIRAQYQPVCGIR